MSVYRLDFQARDSSQTLSCSFERNSWNTGSFAVETVHSSSVRFGCTLTFYVQRIGRDVSIGTIFLLSVFQVIIIPSDSRWAELKRKAPQYVGTFSILCWIFSIILSVLVSFYVTAQWNNTINTNNIDHGYCYLWHAAPKPQMRSLAPRTQNQSSESRTLSKLTELLYNLFKGTLIVTTKLPDSQWGKDAHSSKHPLVPQPIS